MLTESVWSSDMLNNEPGVLIRPRTWQKNTDITGMIYCHGANGNELEPWQVGVNAESMRNIMEGVSNIGVPVLSCYFGGNAWGNGDAIAKLSAAVQYMQQTVGTNPNKIVLFGQSMGHLTAMNWAAQNKAKVACVVSSMGVTDLNDIHGQSYGASIDSAYPNGPSDYNSSTYNPIVNASAKFSGIPWQGWIGNSDVVAQTSKMQQFGALLGSKAEVNVTNGGHNWTTVGTFNIAKITAFIARNTNID